MSEHSYIIITPAYNEEQHLERTIRAVLAQTVRPLCWVIVNDGSTDRTGDIATQYAARADFIRVITIQREAVHAFSKKANAFNRGVEMLRGLDYDLIGNLDADISVEPPYFENLIREFKNDEALGITGGAIYTKIGDRFVTQDETLDSVAGAVQLFRKECFQDVGGGYLPLPYGGIDAAAEIIAKMKGWKVRKSPENKTLEHRQTGTATTTPVVACYRLGRRFHSLGYGTLFFGLRCLYRITDEPVIAGSCAQFLGFMESLVRRRPVQLPVEAVRHLRQEQRQKLCKRFFPWRDACEPDAR
jgi:biofilm PGA synthesis N-glycosyltransferase PgaC